MDKGSIATISKTTTETAAAKTTAKTATKDPKG
jgi:hypothetical protein